MLRPRAVTTLLHASPGKPPPPFLRAAPWWPARHLRLGAHTHGPARYPWPVAHTRRSTAAPPTAVFTMCRRWASWRLPPGGAFGPALASHGGSTWRFSVGAPRMVGRALAGIRAGKRLVANLPRQVGAWPACLLLTELRRAGGGRALGASAPLRRRVGCLYVPEARHPRPRVLP